MAADSHASAEDFAGILVAARRRAGLTQAEVATAAGLTPSYLSFLENRRKPPPSEDVCRRLAAALDLDATELVEIAHTERAPDSLRQRLRRLDSSLKRERRTRKRLLRSLLSPFLFAGPPGYLSDALETVKLSSARRRRLRQALTAVGRRNQDRAAEVADIIDALPDRERDRLLDALPDLIARGAGSRIEPGEADASPETDEPAAFPLPPDAGEHAGRFRVTVDDGWTDLAVAGDDVRAGDEVTADPGLDPAAGDLVVLRNGDRGGLARVEVDDGAFVLVRANPAGHIWREPPREDEAWTDRLHDCGAAVVVEVRRPFRRQPR